jgi:hypothetical protein
MSPLKPTQLFSPWALHSATAILPSLFPHRFTIFVPTTLFPQLFAPNNLKAKGAAYRRAKLPSYIYETIPTLILLKPEIKSRVIDGLIVTP